MARTRQKRSAPRAQTITAKRLTREERDVRVRLPVIDEARPSTRGDCEACPICQEYIDAANRSAGPIGVPVLGGNDPALHQPEEPRLQELRGEGHRSVPPLEGELSRVRRGHGTETIGRALDRAHQQRDGLLPGELSLGDSHRAESEQVELHRADDRRPNAADDRLGEGTRRSRPDDQPTTSTGVESLACGHDPTYAWRRCRPCAFVGCAHHLYIDITDVGSLKINFPDLEPWELNHSCSLDVTEGGELTLDIVGARMNLTRERIRQVETRAMHRLADVLRARRIVERAKKRHDEQEVAA